MKNNTAILIGALIMLSTVVVIVTVELATINSTQEINKPQIVANATSSGVNCWAVGLLTVDGRPPPNGVEIYDQGHGDVFVGPDIVGNGSSEIIRDSNWAITYKEDVGKTQFVVYVWRD